MIIKQDNLGFLVSDVARLLRRNFQQRLEGSLLTFAQARLLVHVSRREGVRQIDLADFLEIQPITLARLIDQLESAGLVERRPDQTDRRAYKIYLSNAAEPHLLLIENIAAELRSDAFQGLDDQEAAIVTFALQKIAGNLASR
ncbi:MAG: MarR family winged helix-turn-helix transcriptional regulator [Methylotenera sp.]